ncbi:MFS general substrate transporter [Macroventuria anomochaeta]|uniref:MFS general substrate transporter n=1 Tax=Macroventuria anomochaeta TaxID=301207 RepID=A0ACB6S8B3_9PLEO|nr:MFS general substrate transporter [Macroventuria anomochaeta]KAF2630510.1 MFS general substrate transporter [Macroventuria anomochaeta]
MLTVSLLTSLGFMLIGYENGLMGGLVNAPALKDTFNNPSANMIGTVVAFFEIGCFLGAMTNAFVGGKLGRRKSVGIAAVISLIGALLQATTFGRAHLIVGRIVSGIGLALDPRLWYHHRVLDRLCFRESHSELSWRVPTTLQCVIIFAILILSFMIPGMPRWLAAHDRPEECLAVLARIKGSTGLSNPEVQRLHTVITETVAYENSRQARWKEIVRSDSIKSRRRFLIACGIQIFRQREGITAIILQRTVSKYCNGPLANNTHMASLMSGFLQTWFFVASFIPWFLIDRIGRRPMLLSMISVMAAVMAVQAALIYQVHFDTSMAKSAGIAAAAMLFIFQGAFTIGFLATV